MQKIYVLAGLALMMASCGGNEKDYDATGTFEATEITVFAEQSGALLSFDLEEGDKMEANRQVGARLQPLASSWQRLSKTRSATKNSLLMELLHQKCLMMPQVR